MSNTIPTVPNYTGEIALRTDPENFPANAEDQYTYLATLSEDLNVTVDSMNVTGAEVESNANAAANSAASSANSAAQAQDAASTVVSIVLDDDYLTVNHTFNLRGEVVNELATGYLWKPRGTVTLPYTTDIATYPLASQDPNLAQISAINELETVAISVGTNRGNISYDGAGETVVGYIYSPSQSTTYSVPSDAQGKTILTVVDDLLTTSDLVEYTLSKANTEVQNIKATNAAEFIAAVAHIKALAVEKDATMSLPGIDCNGQFDFTSGLIIHPWIKLHSNGTTLFNFDIPESTRALVINNDNNVTTNVGKNAANTGPMFNGCFFISGADRTRSDTVGVTVGNDFTSTGDTKNFRDVNISNLVVGGFEKLYDLKSTDTYLCSLQNSRLEGGGSTALSMTDGVNVNSGERLTFFNDTFAGAPTCIDLNTPGIDLNFISCSFDFCKNTVLALGASATFLKVSFTLCHFEASNDIALIDSLSASPVTLMVTVTDCKVVPRNRDTTLPNTYPDTKSCPRVPLFKGPMTLKIDGLYLAYENPLASANGLFLCDDDVTVISAKNIVYSGWRQAISKSFINNFNYNFNNSVSGEVIDGTNVTEGWTVDNRASELSAIVSSAKSFDDSANSIKITNTGGSPSSFISIISSRFSVEGVQQAVNGLVLHADGTTGDVAAYTYIYSYSHAPRVVSTITAIQRFGVIAVADTATSHGLVVGDEVYISGVDIGGYNGTRIVRSINSATQFTYACDGSLTSIPTVTGATVDNNGIRCIDISTQLGALFSDIYGDINDPSYTGDRNFWAKQKLVFASVGVAGAEFCRLAVNISRLDDGDVIYIGAALITKQR